MAHLDGHQPKPLTLTCFDINSMAALCIVRLTDELNCELAVLHPDFPGGPSDTRLVQEGTISGNNGKELSVRVFFPSSCCGVILEKGAIGFTEPGLRGLEGRQVTKLKFNNTDDELLIVWRGQPQDITELQAGWIYRKTNGLALAFCWRRSPQGIAAGYKWSARSLLTGATFLF